MWLSEVKRKNEAGITSAQVCLAGDNDAILLSPANVVRLPKAGETQLMLECSDGECVLLGTLGTSYPDSLAEGEIYIQTDKARIKIKNNGAVNISGSVNITGTLTLNGQKITV